MCEKARPLRLRPGRRPNPNPPCEGSGFGTRRTGRTQDGGRVVDPSVAPLLDAIRERGFQPETCAMDKGYDNPRVMGETRERGCVPIVSLRKNTPIPLDRIPYGSDEWKRLYRGRAAVEREFGRLKNEYALTPLRTRGLARVRLHADLVMLARLGQALARSRALARAA